MTVSNIFKKKRKRKKKLNYVLIRQRRMGDFAHTTIVAHYSSFDKNKWWILFKILIKSTTILFIYIFNLKLLRGVDISLRTKSNCIFVVHCEHIEQFGQMEALNNC